MSDRSRLIVLGLPPALTRDALKAHFASINLPITDTRILTNKSGHSRRVGFIGFKTNADAEHARSWFNGTWLAGSRIKVEFAEEAVTSAPSDSRANNTSQTANAEPLTNVSVAEDDSTAFPSSSHAKRAASPEPETDADYLAKRLKRHVTDAVDTAEGAADSSTSESNATKAAAPTTVEEYTDDSNQEPGRLFLRNLAYSVTQDDIQEAFAKYGEVTEVHLPQAGGAVNKGIAFVKFKDETHADAARQALDGKSFCGRLIHVLQASKLPRVAGRESHAGSAATEGGYKQRKQVELKDKADRPFNWSTLYMNSDAVLTSLASKYGIPKSDVMDMSSTDAAARLALAEAVIIQETKDYFQSHGVHVEAFTSTTQRSKTTLLLKNLPPDSTRATVKSLLPEACQARRIVVSPTGTLALFELADASRTVQVLKALAYKKLGNNVLFVERAPGNIWAGDSVPDLDEHRAVETGDSQPKTQDGDNAQPSSDTSLFVSGLPSDLSIAAFRALFQGLPGYTYSRCTRSPSTSGSTARGNLLGFVGFSSLKHAENAKTVMDGHVVDGHVLRVQASRGPQADTGEDVSLHKARSETSKILIKNLPFETNRQDLMKVVSAYGSVLSLRLPKNAQARSRGFAFVQFATPSEAASAQAGLAHTHILGRHVIVETAH